jgi:hypothetical protein
VFEIPFMVSGSTWPFENLRVLSNVEGLTALSRSKGYRTMNGKFLCLFVASCRAASITRFSRAKSLFFSRVYGKSKVALYCGKKSRKAVKAIRSGRNLLPIALFSGMKTTR